MAAEAHVLTVDNLDGGATDAECMSDCSLRDAFQVARDSNDADTDRILFSSGLSGTITLTAGQLPFVDEPLEVVGPGPGVLTVSGNGTSRVIRVDGSADTPVEVSGLRLAAGSTPEHGGAVYSEDADLTLLAPQPRAVP